jgi:integrase
MECALLRVKDVDFQRHEIVVRQGKGGKDRITMLPLSPVQPVREPLGPDCGRRQRSVYEECCSHGKQGFVRRSNWSGTQHTLWFTFTRGRPQAELLISLYRCLGLTDCVV